MSKRKIILSIFTMLIATLIIPSQSLFSIDSSHSAYAQVAAPGYAVTTFATGFSFLIDTGPVGITFDALGNLLVGDYANGFIYKFGSAGGVASPSTQLNTLPICCHITGLAFTRDGHLYLARQAAGDVVELNPSTGTVIRTVAFIPLATGLAVDPLSGDLFVDQASGSGKIYRVSNFASSIGMVSLYANVDADGLAFAPDGTLYAAERTCCVQGLLKITGTNSPTPGVVTFLAKVPNIDGIAVSALPGTPFVLGNRNDGIITKIDLTTSPPTLINIVTSGSRGDFVAVGSDGCLYATQTSSIIKVTNADGSCLTPPLGPLFPSNPSVPPTPTCPDDNKENEPQGENGEASEQVSQEEQGENEDNGESVAKEIQEEQDCGQE